MQNAKLGILTMAFGHAKYLRQAENLALSLRRHMPGIPLAIVSDSIVDRTLFDFLVPINRDQPLGTVSKIGMYDHSPFLDTLFIDSDCIVTRPFHQELSAIRKFEFTPIVLRYLRRGERDPFLYDLARALDAVHGVEYPKFNGGVYFFSKGASAAQVFSRARELLNRAAELGIRSFDDAGAGEETLFALALSSLGYSRDQLYDDLGTLMRTPLDIRGRLHIDALGGGCAFNKGGSAVTPAICHFCGDWCSSPEYLIAEYALRNDRKPSRVHEVLIRARHARELPSRVVRRFRRASWRLRH